MKFFYINNSQCTDCDRCSQLCPTLAIYMAQEKRYINYDKCTSCGMCIKSCNVGAITVETVERITVEMEQIEGYRDRIQRLESELSSLKERMRIIEQISTEVVVHLPVATFIADSRNRILIANPALVSLLDINPLNLAQMQQNLAGESIENVFPQEMVQLLRMSQSEEGSMSYVTQINSRRVSFAVWSMEGDLMLGVIRDLSAPGVVAQDVVAMLRETIDRKMAMVQNIGSLLGEEVSVVVNNLNRVINIVESSGDAK